MCEREREREREQEMSLESLMNSLGKLTGKKQTRTKKEKIMNAGGKRKTKTERVVGHVRTCLTRYLEQLIYGFNSKSISQVSVLKRVHTSELIYDTSPLHRQRCKQLFSELFYTSPAFKED